MADPGQMLVAGERRLVAGGRRAASSCVAVESGGERAGSRGCGACAMRVRVREDRVRAGG
jgi:hypothetical protein